MAKKNIGLLIFEIIWYSFTGAIALWGLTFITLGVVARNLKPGAELIKGNDAWQKVMKLSFFESGLIIFVGAVLAAVVVLLIAAKKADREVEKQQRRAARLAAASSTETQETEQPAE